MPVSRRVLIRRWTVAGVIAVVVIGAGAYVPLSLLTPLSAAETTVTAWTEPPREPAALQLPGTGSSALGAVGFEGVLAQSGSAEPRPIASITKVITALVVLEAKPLTPDDPGPVITFDTADAALYGKYLAVLGKVEPMRAGLQMTEREALDVVLISSANNYAEAVTRWAFGDEEAFVAAASSWISAHGLTSTTIVEPTGISPQNVSSPADLVRLGEIALEHPVVAAIVASPAASVPYIGGIENTNDLLGISGVDGIKTGTLDEAGSCLLFSADYVVGGATVTVIGVVLGGVDGDSVDAAVTALLAGVPQNFHEVTLATKGQEFADYSTEWDDGSAAVAKEDARVTVWSDQPIHASVEVDAVTLTERGEAAGTVAFTVAGRSIRVPLAFDDPIDEPGIWWRITHPIAEILR